MLKKILLVGLIIFEAILVVFIVSLFDDSTTKSYIQPLRNNYYLEGFIDGDIEEIYLKNSRKDYIYPKNFPTKNLLGKIIKNDTLFLESEGEENLYTREYYIVDMASDEIIGPLNNQEFFDKIRDYWSVDIIRWSNV